MADAILQWVEGGGVNATDGRRTGVIAIIPCRFIQFFCLE